MTIEWKWKYKYTKRNWTVGVMFVVNLVATVFPIIICVSKLATVEKRD